MIFLDDIKKIIYLFFKYFQNQEEENPGIGNSYLLFIKKF